MPAAPIAQGSTEPAAPSAPPARGVIAGPDVDVTPECLRASEHVASLLVAGAGDPAKRATFVQERARIVRRSAEACTREPWSRDRIGCYEAARTEAAIQECNAKHIPVVPPKPPVPDR